MVDPGNRSVDDLVAAAQASSERTDSLIALFNARTQKLKDALSGVSLPPDVQAKVNAVFALEQADAEKIDVALNTDADGTPLPPPVIPPSDGG